MCMGGGRYCLFLFIISNIYPQLEPSTIITNYPTTCSYRTSPTPAIPRPKSRWQENPRRKRLGNPKPGVEKSKGPSVLQPTTVYQLRVI